MPWYLPWSESIKKRACRYLLQRYLGQFLKEKLTLGQLEVDLYNGTGTVSDVTLDIQALNELGEQQNLPLEFVDGYISQIYVYIPWSSLLKESSYVEVSGLNLTVQPKQRADNGASMFESMWNSMTTSMQLAEECLKQSDGKDADNPQPLEGLELFAQTIDSVLSRVKVKFVNIVIRVEHVPKESSSGVAVEFRIKSMGYCDEAGSDVNISIGEEQQPNVYEVAAFTTKKLYIEGMTAYTDEFPSRARTFSKSVISGSSSSSPESKNSDGNYGTAPVTPTSSGVGFFTQDNVTDSSPSNVSMTPDPILFGKFAGRQEVRFKMKQNEGIPGPKVDIEVNCGSLTTFLSPRQLHVLIELMNGLASPDMEDTSNVAPRSRCSEKPMQPSDFHRVEQELQQQLHPATLHTKGLQYAEGWSSAPLDSTEESDEEFLPMQSRTGLADSVASECASMEASVASSLSDSGTKSSCSGTTHRSTGAGVVGLPPLESPFQQTIPSQKRKKSKANTSSLDDPSAEVTHFQVRFSSMAVVLLHDDILTLSVESDGGLAKSSIQEMKTTANNFFQELGHFAVSGYGNKNFDTAKEIFLKSCHLNHIRLLAAPVTIEGNEKTTAVISSICGSVTTASLELLECLVEMKTPTQKATVEYVELLKFKRSSDNESASLGSFPLNCPPDLKMRFQYSEKAVRHGHTLRYSHPRTDISLSLQECMSEIDVSIVDRITAVLNPQPLCKAARNSFGIGQMQGLTAKHTGFYQAVENSSLPDHRLDFKMSSPSFTVKLRFPTPDLRPIHDMDRPPWWKRSVRKDFMIFDLTDASLQTTVDTHEPSRTYELQCSDVQVSFQEADTDTPIPIGRASVDDKNGNSLPNNGEGFDWPRLVIHTYPVKLPGDLEERGDVEREDSMAPSSFETLMNSVQKAPSPFSSKKVIHESDTPHGKSSNYGAEGEGEELVIPGDKQEMADFIEHASSNSQCQIELNLPCCSVQLPSKHLYEIIYNRINTDLFLWEPAAPKPKNLSTTDMYGVKGHAGIDLTTMGLHESHNLSFSTCKSGTQYESDSDSESTDGVYYSVYAHAQRHKRKQQAELKEEVDGQSRVTVTIAINQGLFTLFAPVRDTASNVIPGQHGTLQITFEEGNLFCVSGYKGNPDLGFVCIQANRASFNHNGSVTSSPLDMYNLPLTSCPSAHGEPTIFKSDPGAAVTSTGPVGAGGNSLDMLSVAIKINVDDKTHLKTFQVATAIRSATLRHRMCSNSHSWFTQLVDFFDVLDYPVPGYVPPGVITELHLHLWDCAVDYRPLYLPLTSMITVGSFSISSNIAAQTSTSVLRFIAEDAALFISDKMNAKSVDLKKNYVSVIDLGLFELSLRLCESKEPQSPKVDLRASNNVLHIRTCSDSAKALTELLTYFASDGDLLGHSFMDEVNSDVNEALHMTDMVDNINNVANLSKSQVDHVHDMMEEAMKETNGSKANKRCSSPGWSGKQRGVEVFFFPDENHPIINAAKSQPENQDLCRNDISRTDIECCTEDSVDNTDEEFCILEDDPGSGIMPQSGEPEIRILTQEPIRVVDNHFTVPLGKTDLLKAPKHFPLPVLCYTLREMTVIWHMYGGQDFATVTPKHQSKKQVKIEDKHGTDGITSAQAVPFSNGPYGYPNYNMHSLDIVTFSKSSPQEVKFTCQSPVRSSPQPVLMNSPNSWQIQGGPGRQHDIRVELQLNKVRFQHEVYPENTTEASRQVLLINDVEIRDRLASSEINKFLYQYSSEARPKQSHAHMVVIKALHVRPDPKLSVQECCLKVSLLPIRLNIDQDSLLFMYNFFSEISGVKKQEDEDSRTSTPRHTPTHQAPVMTVNVGGTNVTAPEPQQLLIMLEETAEQAQQLISPLQEGSDGRPPSPPIFFRSFIFSPEVPIRLDYHGKHVDMTHGPLAGLLMGLGQLNCSELRLKRLSYRHGLLGFDKLISYMLSEWLQDIKKNQLPSLLGGVGPMHSLVQLFQGIRDLFWLPIEQYQKDGRIVRGLQRGANSFTTSTAMAALELTSRLVQAVQSTAETAYDMVSPGPSVRRRLHGMQGKRRRYNQPADIREGMANAYHVVKEGLGETAQTIVRVASEEHEQKGVSGAVGGVLRQIPPTVVKPIILATEATSNVLGGMRSQLVPDARKEAVEKWRTDKV